MIFCIRSKSFSDSDAGYRIVMQISHLDSNGVRICEYTLLYSAIGSFLRFVKTLISANNSFVKTHLFKIISVNICIFKQIMTTRNALQFFRLAFQIIHYLEWWRIYGWPPLSYCSFMAVVLIRSIRDKRFPLHGNSFIQILAPINNTLSTDPALPKLIVYDILNLTHLLPDKWNGVCPCNTHLYYRVSTSIHPVSSFDGCPSIDLAQ